MHNEPIPGTAIVTPSAILQPWTADKIKGRSAQDTFR